MTVFLQGPRRGPSTFAALRDRPCRGAAAAVARSASAAAISSLSGGAPPMQQSKGHSVKTMRFMQSEPSPQFGVPCDASSQPGMPWNEHWHLTHSCGADDGSLRAGHMYLRPRHIHVVATAPPRRVEGPSASRDSSPRTIQRRSAVAADHSSSSGVAAMHRRTIRVVAAAPPRRPRNIHVVAAASPRRVEG